MRFFYWKAALFAVTLSLCNAQTTNILAAYNGNFESGLTNWRFFEVPTSIGSTAEVSTDAAQGIKAIKITFVAPLGITDRALDTWNTNIPVQTGTTYTLSVKSKVTSGTGVKLSVIFGFFNSGRTVISQFGQSYSLTSAYQTFTFAETAPATAAYCWVAFRLRDASNNHVAGTFFLDDVQLTTPIDTVYNKVDRTTLTNKLMCGYQGWFAVPSDAINRGWYHYKLNGTFAPGSCKFDLWPDMSEMDSDEKYLTPGFVTASGDSSYLFSAQNRKTVVRHFKWMSDYGIDGVFIQRFATEVFGAAGQTQFNNVLANCQAGAQQYGRVFAVMYDLSGMKAGDWKKVLTDWRTQIVGKNILQDSCYLYHKGKPVVAVWGIGFNDGRAYTLSECDQLIDSLKNHPLYGGNTVMLGVPKGWRTLNGDAVTNDTLTSIILKSDIVSPWLVGRYSTLSGVTTHANNVVAPDISWCSANNKDYLPVAFPGFSWHNMNSASPQDQIPRLGGQFLWQQYYEFIRVGSTMLYQAMFDEIDEATAIFKCTNDPPVGLSTFVTFSPLPPDFYLRLAGRGTQMLRGQISLSSSLPDTSMAGLPVELTSFSATANRFTSSLQWITATETNCFGFEIERRTAGKNEWQKVGFVQGNGTSNSVHAYSFTEADLAPGRYVYRIRQIDNDGSFAFYGNEEVEIGSAAKIFTLSDNYPNPFNPLTKIEFTVPTDGYTTLKVFNVLGEEIATLFDGIAHAGRIIPAIFDASRVSSGIYFTRLAYGGNTISKRIILVK